MSAPALHHHDPLDLKKNARRWVFVIIGTIAGVILLFYMLACVVGHVLDGGSMKVHVGTILKDIRLGIGSYELEYGHYPIPSADRDGPDVSIRTRGPMVTALDGSNATLNPKEIKFIDYPRAKNHKSGLWQDGDEWVLSDEWGEPYYIVLDTNKDGKIANPEFATEAPDASSAQPKELKQSIILYSSGPDRDPKTWKDNVCSRRTR